MAFENDKQSQTPEQDEKQRPEEELVRDRQSFGLPNSLMMVMPMTPPPGTPNSVMREMMDDAEAGHFSGGYAFGSIIAVRSNRSMSAGASLGEGFSFGGGFSAIESGHELNHTIRRSPAPSLFSRSASFNTIQRVKADEGGAPASTSNSETEEKEGEDPAPTSIPETGMKPGEN